jgi:hypothetical protein
MKKLVTTALLASAGFALISMDAKAVGIGDLILGFRVTDNTGTGATKNLELDLGNMSQFTSLAPGTTLNLSSGTTGFNVLDLTTAFGANPLARTDLAWGAMAATGRTGTSGVSGFPLRELWASSGELPSGTAGQVLTAQRSALQAAGSGAYENMVVFNPGDPSSLANTGLGKDFTTTGNPALNSSNAAIEAVGTPPNLNGSWTNSEMNTVANTEFNFFPGTPLDAFTYGGDGINLTSPPTTSILDLYQLDPQVTGTAPAILLGKFSLTQAGVLTYQATPVPEPSSIGLMGVGFLSLVGMVVLRRRRSVVG